MSYATYRAAVLDDDPTVFYPLGIKQPGGASSLFVNEAPRRVVGDLITFSGTPASGLLLPRTPMAGTPDPFIGSTGDLYNNGITGNINTTDLTMEVWVLLTTAGSPADVYPFGIATSGNPWTGIRYYNGFFEVYICNSIGSAAVDQSKIPVLRGVWVHLCASYNGTTRALTFAMNGVTSGVQTGSGGSRQATAAQVFIGRYNSSFGFQWPAGSGVSCLALYDRFDPTMARRHYHAAMGQGRRQL